MATVTAARKAPKHHAWDFRSLQAPPGIEPGPVLVHLATVIRGTRAGTRGLPACDFASRGRQTRMKACARRNSPMCSLSQHGYGDCGACDPQG